MILDSGKRTEFSTGAVRDVQEGKGACHLLPFNVVAKLTGNDELAFIEMFKQTGNVEVLHECLRGFADDYYSSIEEMILEVSKHFEEGMKKYGKHNWQKGIPIERYIDSSVRHLLKFKAGITDEAHDRAFVWNILCCIWTMENKPELDDFTMKGEEEV